MNTEDPTPDPEQPQASKLPSQWDAALLGATVSTVHEDQFVYSLRKLIMLVMNARKVQAPEARQVIYHEMIKPFSREVVFVNDELLEPIEEEKSRIVVPRNLGGRRWSR